MASVRVDLRLFLGQRRAETGESAYLSAHVPAGSGRRDALLTATNTLFTGGGYYPPFAGASVTRSHLWHRRRSLSALVACLLARVVTVKFCAMRCYRI